MFTDKDDVLKRNPRQRAAWLLLHDFHDSFDKLQTGLGKLAGKKKLRKNPPDMCIDKVRIFSTKLVLSLLDFMPNGDVPDDIQAMYPDVDFNQPFDDEDDDD